MHWYHIWYGSCKRSAVQVLTHRRLCSCMGSCLLVCAQRPKCQRPAAAPEEQSAPYLGLLLYPPRRTAAGVLQSAVQQPRRHRVCVCGRLTAGFCECKRRRRLHASLPCGHRRAFLCARFLSGTPLGPGCLYVLMDTRQPSSEERAPVQAAGLRPPAVMRICLRGPRAANRLGLNGHNRVLVCSDRPC